MIRLKNFFNNLSKPKKTGILIVVVLFALLISIGIPTIARYKNRVTPQEIVVWDGSIATSYKSGDGTAANPYMISNGAELAYFYEQLLTTNYLDTYFALNSDIMLNDGVFLYDDVDKVKYIKDGITYYIKENSNQYYDNALREGDPVGVVNVFVELDNFKGHLDGNSFTIYGLYMTNSEAEQLALFTNLGGNINDLYVDNALINGGNVSAGIASKTSDASISNVLFDGYVIGSDTISNTTKSITLSNKTISISSEDILIESISLDNTTIPTNEVTSKILKGTVSLTNSNLTNTSLTIAGVSVIDANFEITLENDISSVLPVLVRTTDEDVTIELTNLTYEVSYQYATSAGIVGEATNTTIINSINKGHIVGKLNSSGLVGTSINTNIKNSYNTGVITSENNASGLVGMVTNSGTVAIENSYNSGTLEGSNIAGLVNMVSNNTSLDITNCFDTSLASYNINTISETITNINNSYSINGDTVQTGSTTGTFTKTTLANLYSKSFITNTLTYDEFINIDNIIINENSVWIYEDDSLPILYLDDPIASIYAGIYAWNNLSYNVNQIALNSNMIFSIAATDLTPLKKIEYYISNAKTSLTKTQLDNLTEWQEYTSLQELNSEGFYIIYAKITDYKDNVTYLNSDVLILDLTGSNVEISLNNKLWNSYKTNLEYLFIDKSLLLEIATSDLLSGIASTQYYISTEALTEEEIDKIDSWQNYTTPLAINNTQKQAIYVKVVDNSGFVTYANTDYIIYNGYSQGELTIGRNTSNSSDNVNITNKSTISLDFTYIDEIGYLEGNTHNLVSTILLPVNTKITLIDKVTGTIYTYTITSSEDIYGYNSSCSSDDDTCVKKATYPLSNFRTLKVSANEYFDNASYIDTSVNESFRVVLDFSNTNITDNYENVSLYMTIKDSSDNTLRTTLNNTIKTFNIYSTYNSESTDATLFLTTNYDNTTILYNSNSTTNIDIQTGVDYKLINGARVYDTTFENKYIGLQMKLVDSEGNTIDKKYLNSIIIKVDDTEYGAEDDGVFRINLNNGISTTNKTISIITSEDDIKLPIGGYTLNITNYVSYDGLYTKVISNNEVSVPITVTNSISTVRYGFNVMMSDTSKIVRKTTGLFNMPFSITQNGSLKNPNIRVSLYKKDLLSAVNQDYSIVDIQNYVTNTLTNCSENVYYAFENPVRYRGTSATYNNLDLTLITNNLENTGYKFVFELYDGDTKIGTIEKKFIVK